MNKNVPPFGFSSNGDNGDTGDTGDTIARFHGRSWGTHQVPSLRFFHPH
jgi:hypothetical protein